MPEAADTQVFLELTQYSLHALRAVHGKIEAGGECVLENKSALEALLDAVAPTRKADGGIRAGTAVWPPAAQWYLSTDTEAMLDRTSDALRTIAGSRQKDPRSALIYASCNATDGGEVTADGMDKWVMAFAPLQALENVSKTLMDMGIDPDEMKPAGLTALGAVSTAMRAENNDGGVVLWDIGADQSTLVLMTPMGVAETVPCTAGMEAIFEGVQQALKLKFRGAGARLFFNEGYDFTEPGPKIAAVVGKAVKEALSRFPKTAAPPLLTSLSLTGKQAWFIREVAAYVGLQAWEPDMPKLAAKLGLSFKEPELEAAFSSSSTGLFELVSMRIRPRDRWNPEWVEAEEVVEDDMQVVEDDEQIMEPPPESPLRARPSLTTSPSPNLPPPSKAGSRPPVPPRVTGTTPPIPAGGGSTRSPMPRPTPAPFPAASAAPPPGRPPVRPPPPPPEAAPSLPSFPSPGGSAPAFPAPGGGAPRPPSFPTPGGGAPAFPAPGGGAPAFPAPGGGAPRPPSFPIPAFPAPSGGLSQSPFPPASPPPAPAFPVAFPAPEPGGLPAFPAPGATTPPQGYPPPGLPATTPFPPVSAAPLPSLTTFPVPPPEPSAVEVMRAPVTALPFDAGKLRPVGVPGSKVPPGITKAPFGATQPPYEPPAKSKLGLYIGIGVVAALIFAAVAVVVEARLERIKASELEAQEEAARHITEQRLKEAEQSSKEQQEASRKEMELAIAQAKRDAEEEARKVLQAQEEASRAAKQPGTVVIVTDPAGAYVSVDGAPPVMTPAHLGNLAVGSHHFHITRQGYDPADVDGDVKAGQTTTLDTVTLSSIYGSAEFASTPDGLDFSVKPAGDLMAKVVASGTTPMVLPRLTHGDYVATFHRAGCHDHFENFTVAAGERVSVTTAYQDGSLELSSDPSGASVNKDGSFIGTTPLVLHNLTPKVASFELNLPGYDVTPVSCDIPEGTTLKYSAQLLRKDRVFTAAETKTPPVKIEGSMPQLSASQRESGGTAVLSFVVRRDGSVGYIEVVRTTDDDIARRCQSTVEGWKYRPATAPDDRIVDARIEVSFKFPPSS